MNSEVLRKYAHRCHISMTVTGYVYLNNGDYVLCNPNTPVHHVVWMTVHRSR